MRRKRKSWQEQEVRAAQRKIWDAEVKAQQDWNAKPRAEQIEDARFVLYWLPRNAQAVLDGYCWMSEALASAKAVEAKAIQAAAVMGLIVDEVWALLQLPDEERTETLARMGYQARDAVRKA